MSHNAQTKHHIVASNNCHNYSLYQGIGLSRSVRFNLIINTKKWGYSHLTWVYLRPSNINVLTVSCHTPSHLPGIPVDTAKRVAATVVRVTAAISTTSSVWIGRRGGINE